MFALDNRLFIKIPFFSCIFTLVVVHVKVFFTVNLYFCSCNENTKTRCFFNSDVTLMTLLRFT